MQLAICQACKVCMCTRGKPKKDRGTLLVVSCIISPTVVHIDLTSFLKLLCNMIHVAIVVSSMTFESFARFHNFFFILYQAYRHPLFECNTAPEYTNSHGNN